MAAIDGIGRVAGASAGAAASAAKAAGGSAAAGGSFAEALAGALSDASSAAARADRTVADFEAGRTGDVHRVMLDLEKAQLGLKLVVEVRNRALEAYQEVMRMQL